MARVGGIEYRSTNVTVMSQFPSYTQIEGDVDVRSGISFRSRKEKCTMIWRRLSSSIITGSMILCITAIANGDNILNVQNEYMAELRDRLGAKWFIVEKRMSEEYKKKESELLKQNQLSIEKSLAEGSIKAEVAEKIQRHIKLQRDFLDSNYFIVNRELLMVPRPSELSSQERRDVNLITKALSATNMAIQDGAKAVVHMEGDCYIVVFECILPQGVRGADFAAKIIIDENMEDIRQVFFAP
jgi:hypothetical protein